MESPRNKAWGVTLEQRLFYITGVLALGMLAQWLAWQLRKPAILVLLIFGFAAGMAANPEELIGQDLLYACVSIAVAIILFEGGLSLELDELELGGSTVLPLVTLGVLITWLLGSLAAWQVFGLDPAMAALLGAILTVSGPTVVVPLLVHVRPAQRVGSVAKWEGIVIDPIAATLALLVFEVVLTGEYEKAASDTFWRLTMTCFVGVAVGWSAKALVVSLLKRYLVPDFLQNSFLLAVVVGSFAVSNYFRSESGIVAVTLFGVLLANQHQVKIEHLLEFKENLRVLLISSLFIVLASICDVQAMLDLGFKALGFVLLLLLIRPVAVFLSLIGSPLNWRELSFLSWLAPRGIVAAAVSTLFALEMTTRDSTASAERAALSPEMLAQAEMLVPITFSVILGTVVVYGLSLSRLARWLQVSEPNPQGILFVGATEPVRAIAQAVHREGFAVQMVDTNHRHVSAARLAGLSAHCASIVSEYSLESADLAGIGRLLAMTSSQEINALAAIEYAARFGRSEVYSLPQSQETSQRQKPASTRLSARSLFSEQATYQWLADRFAAGVQVKKTRLSEAFSYEDFRSRYGDSALVLFVIDENGTLTICTTDTEPNFKPGQSLISLVDAEQCIEKSTETKAAMDQSQGVNT